MIVAVAILFLISYWSKVELLKIFIVIVSEFFVVVLISFGADFNITVGFVSCLELKFGIAWKLNKPITVFVEDDNQNLLIAQAT
jgi:hypothetical protein